MKANSAVGTALQAGANFMVSDRWGGFVDVKKAFVSTTAFGMSVGAPTLQPSTSSFRFALPTRLFVDNLPDAGSVIQTRAGVARLDKPVTDDVVDDWPEP